MSTTPHIQRAELLMELRRYDAALKELLEALKHDPEDVTVFENLTWCFYRQKQYSIAEEWAAKVVAASPDSYSGYYYLSICAGSQGQLDKAKKYINQALKCNPYWSGLYGYKAELFIAEEEWEKAEEEARKGLAINPDDKVCQKNLTAALTKLRAKNKLEESLKIALERSPDDAGMHLSAGWSLLETGKIKAAREHFEVALAKNPEEPLAKEGLLEAIKAKNLLYRLLLKIDFAVAARPYSERRWFLVLFTFTLVCFGVLATMDSMWWLLLLIPLALTLQVSWLVKETASLGVFLFNKKYKDLYTPRWPTMHYLANQGVTIAFFIFTLNFFRKADDYGGLLILVSAIVLFLTVVWRKHYLHLQTTTNGNVKYLSIGLSSVAGLFLLFYLITGASETLGALFFVGVIYGWMIDKIYTWKIFN